MAPGPSLDLLEVEEVYHEAPPRPHPTPPYLSRPEKTDARHRSWEASAGLRVLVGAEVGSVAWERKGTTPNGFSPLVSWRWAVEKRNAPPCLPRIELLEVSFSHPRPVISPVG